jgi:hypothetical protein
MDSISVEILSDGTVKVTTDQVSTANHRNADDLLELVDRLMGGTTTKNRNPVAHSHRQHGKRAGHGS